MLLQPLLGPSHGFGASPLGAIGEIGTLSWFWHFTQGKTLRVPISPILVDLVKTLATKIGEIGEIGTLSWFWRFTLRGNRGNRDPLSILPGWSAKTMRGSLFPLFWWPMSWQDDKTWTTKIGEIGEIGTLSWFWHLTFGEIGEIGEIWMKTCMIKNVFGIDGYWANKCNPQTYKYN